MHFPALDLGSGAKMRPSIVVQDSFSVPFAGAVVEQCLRDFGRYSEWWPRTFRVRSDLSVSSEAVVFQPVPGVSVGWMLRQGPVEEGCVFFEYHRGPHHGSGRWRCAPKPGGGTDLSLEIEVQPKNALFALGYRLTGFARRHSRDIETLVVALEQELQRRGRSSER